MAFIKDTKPKAEKTVTNRTSLHLVARPAVANNPASSTNVHDTATSSQTPRDKPQIRVRPGAGE